MKKMNVINLIKYYVDQNDSGFRSEAYEIANDFAQSNDEQLAEYIMALLSDVNTFVPQMNKNESALFEKVEKSSEGLFLPDDIFNDITGIVHAISRNLGVNKFLFQGAPGTGKTEAVKQLARILDREIFMVNFSAIVDSRLGQTQKNISSMFKEINSFVNPDKVIVLIDEIDAVALDRTNNNDLREMGRATSAMLKGFDNLNSRILLIATTNLFEYFDKALIRRFDSVINFNRYSTEDLLEVAVNLLDFYLKAFKLEKKDIRLFKKIILLSNPIPYPGDLKNIIKTSVAFSSPDDSNDYLKRLYYAILKEKPNDLVKLREQGFTVREIQALSNVSRSNVSRMLKEGMIDE